MEHVTDIDKKKYIDDCKKIVNEVMNKVDIELTDHELTLLTEEIMDTVLMMGGDYAKDNIENVTWQYVHSQFLSRFKAAHHV